MNANFWKSKTVFLTGHTGFKGGWMAHWLCELGASVHGYSLEPPTVPNFFTESQLTKRLSNSVVGNILDLAGLTDSVRSCKPDIIIHMAAQPLVRESYKKPDETFATNVMGTVNILEAARQTQTVRAIVNITTDKCYDNKEWVWSYRESDRLGGHDPYSASKACAEIVVAAYRNSFLADSKVHIGSVRAGNVIGGGDWATDRLIPDFLRALDSGKILSIRSPNAIRPWQHVLEPLSGYLLLAERLLTAGDEFAGAWNFGPNDEGAKPVSWIADQMCKRTPKAKWQVEKGEQPHEAGLLKLDSSKAKANLGWLPRWDLETALDKTIEWHQAWRNRGDMADVTSEQIKAYIES